MAQPWPPSRFWQYWALAGMLVLTAAFWWSVEGMTLFAGATSRSQIADGLLRFSLLILTPMLVLVWLLAAWLRHRIGESGFWRMLGLVAMIWGGSVLVTRILVG